MDKPEENVLPTENQLTPEQENLIEHLFSYHTPDEPQQYSLMRVRTCAKIMARTILQECPVSADRSDAIRSLRNCVMTANASIVLKGIS
jgi:hypothetical protein